MYLSLAPKSNSLYVAYETAKLDAQKMLAEPVPLQIRNAPTQLMKDLRYGEGYQYAHDTQEKLTDMECLPDSLRGKVYYQPTDQGSEARAKERLERIKPGKRSAAGISRGRQRETKRFLVKLFTKSLRGIGGGAPKF